MRHKAVKLLTILLLSSITVLAQGGGRPGPGGPKPNRINFLATVLSLTDDQKQQATAIFDAAEQASTSLRDSLRQQRQTLNDAAKASAADSQIDQLATTLGDLTGQLAAIQTKAFAKFYTLLTADQRTKLDQLQANGRGMRGASVTIRSGLTLRRPAARRVTDLPVWAHSTWTQVFVCLDQIPVEIATIAEPSQMRPTNFCGFRSPELACI